MIKQIKKKTVKKCIRLFLLGLLVSKVSVNYRYKRIFVQFPVTKAKLAYMLQAEFGGSVYIKPYTASKNEYTCYELKSKTDLRNLLNVVESFDGVLPEESLETLKDYLQEFK